MSRHQNSSRLLALPSEILNSVGQLLQASDVFSLSSTCSHLRKSLNLMFYHKLALEEKEGNLLLMACQEGLVEMVKRLFEAGARPNFKSLLTGNTPLLEAVINEHASVVELIIGQPGVDPNETNDSYETALIVTADEGYSEIARLLLKMDNIMPDKEWTDWLSPLALAAMRGHLNVVEELLANANVDRNHVDRHDATPLLLAIEWYHLDVVVALLEDEETALEIRDEKGRTALNYAIESDSSQLVSLLLYYGADVNNQDIEERTPLMRATTFRSPKAIMDALLACEDVNVDARDVEGRTALSYAAEAGNWRDFRILLLTGKADPHAADDFGKTPLWYAVNSGRMYG